MELFRRITEDFAKLTSDELRELVAEYRSLIARLASRDDELIAQLRGDSDEFTDADLLAVVQEGTEGVLKIDAVLGEREAATAEADATLAELAAKAGAADPTPGEDDTAEDGADDGTEQADDADAGGDNTADDQAADAEADATGDADADAATDTDTADQGTDVAIAAAGSSRAVARPGKRNRPRDAAKPRTVVTAAADVPGLPAGSPVDNVDGMVGAFQSAFAAVHRMPATGARVPVLRATTPYPEHLRLGRDTVGNSEIVKRAQAARRSEQRALAASGGFCAPATPIYELPQISVPDRPVRDSLMSFNAVRGGIQFAEPISINSITTAVGVVTNEDDALGGTNAAKTKQRIDCPDFTTVFVDAVYNWLEFGNLGAMAWPEQIANMIEVTNAAHARVAETNLLDTMVALRTSHLTAGTTLGAVADLVDHILRAAAGYRSRFRMRADTVLDVWFPSWVPDLLLADVFKTQFHRFDFDRDSIARELFQKANVRVTWYMDTPTGLGQVFAATDSGTLDNFPGTVEWFIAPADTVGFLDGGTLDLGIVRDSTTNEVNDYQVFSETFEALYFVGNQLIQVTSTVAASGAVKNPV